MNQVVYANGLLYSGVNTIIGDGSRTGIAWFAVKPNFSRRCRVGPGGSTGLCRGGG